jgi:transposase
MARPRNIGLRRLAPAERALLKEKLQDKTLAVRIHERYRVIAEAAQGREPKEIADRVGVHFTMVYDWIHRFNRHGFAKFEDAPNPKGRPSSLSARQIRKLIATALARPQDLGLPFTQWSVAKLKDYCHRQRLLPAFSDEWVRRLLRREGLSFQRTRTWKESPDPHFESKKTAF